MLLFLLYVFAFQPLQCASVYFVSVVLGCADSFCLFNRGGQVTRKVILPPIGSHPMDGGTMRTEQKDKQEGGTSLLYKRDKTSILNILVSNL